MDEGVRKVVDELGARDDKVRAEALRTVLAWTEGQVDWIYEVWDDLLAQLEHDNSFLRSTAIKVLCNLAKSDREGRLPGDLDRILAHTHDEKFVTSRQCLQELWKLAATGEPVRARVLEHLEARFRECQSERHYNLLRLDVLGSLMALYHAEGDEKLLQSARAMVALEPEEKYRKKYLTLLVR